MKKGKVIAICAFSLCAVNLFSPTAFADYSVQYNGGDSPFYINGRTEVLKQGQTITLRVQKEDKTLYLRQSETDIDGKYHFFVDLQQYGKATLLVMKGSMQENGRKELYKSTTDEVNTALGRLNSDEDVATVLQEEANVLQINSEEFVALKSDLLLEYIESKKTYSSLSTFLESWQEACFLVRLRQSTSAEEARKLAADILDEKTLMNKYAGKIYQGDTAEKQTAVFEKLFGKEFRSMGDFYEGLYGAVILREWSSKRNYLEKFSILKDNNDFLELNLNLCDQLGIKADELQQDLANLSLSEIEASEVKSKIAEEYRKLYEKYSEEPPSGYSGGGGNKKNVSVDSSFVPESQYPEATYFKDLSGYEWAREAIDTLAANGILSGREENLFSPRESVTRAEVIQMLVKACNMREKTGETVDFEDVSIDFWGYPSIAAAKSRGIIQGNENGRFQPNEKVTRQDMTVMCYRALQTFDILLQEKTQRTFSDYEKIAPYAQKAVSSFGNAGLMNGRDQNCFAPHETATRAEAAKLIYELWKLVNGKV